MLEWFEKHLLPCAYHTLLGIDCPLCGFQRAFILLLKGNVRDSFFQYPPLVFILALLVLTAFYLLFKTKFIKQLLTHYAFGVLCVITVNYILKFI